MTFYYEYRPLFDTNDAQFYAWFMEEREKAREAREKAKEVHLSEDTIQRLAAAIAEAVRQRIYGP